MLPSELSDVVERYLALASDRVVALYVIGSVALGDWTPPASDLDLVAVVPAPLVVPSAAGELREWHGAMRQAFPTLDLEVLYVTRGDLAGPPERAGERPHHRDGLLRRDAHMCTPVVWHSVAEYSIVVRPDGAGGDGGGSVVVHRDEAALRDWCRENLASYWAGWAARGANDASRAGMALLTDWGVAWCVLGVLRLHYTIVTGEITSKSGAGSWALSGGMVLDPAERALVAEALRLRHVAEPLPPIEREHATARREAVVAFLRRLVAPGAAG